MSADLAELDIVGFWSIRGEYEMAEPHTVEQPAVWAAADYVRLGLEASRTIPVEEADRRNLFFSNPGLPGTGLITRRLFGGVQVINPGEVAPVHRHTGAASRVMLEGTGGYTTVEGDKCVLEYGDVVLNPNGAWHENGNEGPETIMWFDVLDIPFTKLLGANFFDSRYTEPDRAGAATPQAYQTVSRTGWSSQAYGTGGVRPAYVQHTSARGHGSVQLCYRYTATRALLDTLRPEPGSPWEGVSVELFDPGTGGPAMRTLDVYLQLLRPHERIAPLRRTAGTAYCCLEGSGRTSVDGQSLSWRRGDVFVVPGWAWRFHEADDADAVLYSVSDAPAMRALGLLVEDRQQADGTTSRDWR